MILPKKSSVTYVSHASDIQNHFGRFVLAEKNVSYEVEYRNLEKPSEDFLILNPYNTLPVLVDRDLVLCDVAIIVEYLDERFPHPPLLPVYPVARARTRTMMQRIVHDWYCLIIEMEQTQLRDRSDDLKQRIIKMTSAFEEKDFFLSNDMTLVDCMLGPLLWRLPHYGVFLDDKSPILSYADRIFKRDSFINSLSDDEREMRDDYVDEL